MTGATAPEEALDPLARRAREGSEEAFRRLARRIHPRVYRWALSRTGDADDADDVAQEVLLRVHRKLSSWDGRGRFTTWLYAVTRNASLDRVGRRRRTEVAEEAARSAGGEAPGPAREEPRPGDAIDDARAAALVRSFFRELPERQREVFDLADLQGYAPVEIAGMLDVAPGTVRAHLFRARRTIRRRILEDRPELVEEYGEEEPE